jgi:hypothetical protein
MTLATDTQFSVSLSRFATSEIHREALRRGVPAERLLKQLIETVAAQDQLSDLAYGVNGWANR